MPKKTVSSTPQDDIVRASRLLDLINSSWKSQAIYAAVELGIPDILYAGSKSLRQIAGAVRADPQATGQLLRALCTLGLVKENIDESFVLTKTGKLLAEEAALSLNSWARYWGGFAWSFWGNLLDSVRTGESARSKITGKEGFEHLEDDEARAKIFNEAMSEVTKLVSGQVVDSYDFSGKMVIDVGGGYGELLFAILEAYQDAKGTIFDRPHAIKEAKRRIKDKPFADRCGFASGDFFKDIPRGGDIYLLKSIIHDWDDARSLTILKNCRLAMEKESRLVLVERIMPARLGESVKDQSLARSDLQMLVALASRERTKEEFVSLLESSGFRDIRFVNTKSTHTIIEASAA